VISGISLADLSFRNPLPDLHMAPFLPHPPSLIGFLLPAIFSETMLSTYPVSSGTKRPYDAAEEIFIDMEKRRLIPSYDPCKLFHAIAIRVWSLNPPGRYD